MGEQQGDMSWETNELLNWLINDEGLYNEGTRIAARLYRPDDQIKTWVMEETNLPRVLGEDFEWHLVDWDEVVEHMQEDDDES
jgi:hypothetical protein